MTAEGPRVTTPCPACGHTFTGAPGDLYRCNGGGAIFAPHAYFRMGDGRPCVPPARIPPASPPEAAR